MSESPHQSRPPSWLERQASGAAASLTRSWLGRLLPAEPRTTIGALWCCLVAWLRIALPLQLALNGVFLFLEQKPLADSRLFATLRREGFSWIASSVGSEARRVSDGALPIVVIDTSRLVRVNFDGQPPTRFAPRDDFTPRLELAELVRRLGYELDAAAIGIDIDFSPDPGVANGASPRGHEDLLDLCLALHRGTAPTVIPVGAPLRRAPVFLAVGRASATPDRSAWLGPFPGISDLAATALLCTDDAGVQPPIYSLLPERVRFVGTKPPLALESLSFRLAAAIRISSEGRKYPAAPPAHGLFLARAFELESAADPAARLETFTVNFARRAEIVSEAISAERVLTADSAALAELRGKIRGRAVLLGDVELPQATDLFVLPGEGRLMPGVVAHACGVLTLLEAPLWRIHFWGIWGETLFGLLISMIGAVLAWSLWHGLFEGRSHVRAEIWGLIVTIVVIVATGFLLARLGGIFWLGALSTAFSSACETTVKLFLSAPGHRDADQSSA